MLTINSYDPSTMLQIGSAITGISFGNVAAGNHATTVNVIKPVAQAITLNEISLFLESKGGFASSNFGFFKSLSAITGITAGSNYLSGNFTEMPGVSTLVTGGLNLTAGSPEFVWLDADVQAARYGTGNLNYRFVYDFT